MREAEVIAVCGLPFEAAIAAGPRVRVVRALGLPDEALRKLGVCAGIISFGCAGGLDPALRPGDCLLPDAVQTPAGIVEADRQWLAALRRMLPYAHGGALIGAARPCSEAADKVRLWRLGARAVDMESHRAALAARSLGTPFVALRAIADPAWRTVPSCVLAGLSSGEVALAPMLRALAAHPTQLPALLMLAADALVAKRTLQAARALAGDAFSVPRRAID
ncbi:phosphorylase [Massilia terrae]|uniref:Squalene--hopene cyclase n=1 Tax=Massilia terrae TaxID=1811224 RepID=A0ABT2CYX1_9BURK|nr:squalene--hopene cyclase [Massilia terrae]MCS0659171.1 squalene--hopene cyclase [Massilia terrae]